MLPDDRNALYRPRCPYAVLHNEYPEDRPLLATPEGVDLVNDILAEAHMEFATTQRSR